MKKQIIAGVISIIVVIVLAFQGYIVYQDHKQIEIQNQNWALLNKNFAQAVVNVINQAIAQTASTTKK